MQLTTKKISTRFPEELLEEMDLIAQLEHMDRTELMKQAVRDFLRKMRKTREFKENVVNLYLEGRIPFGKLELILGKEDALSIKASKEIMERGEELARKLA